jgi:hypothetical protein
MKNLILITIAFSIFGCTKSKKQENSLKTDSLKIVSKDSSFIELENNYVINDSIIDILFGFSSVGENINDLKLNSFNLKKSSQINIHNPNIVDTIYNYQNNSGYLNIYKAGERYILSDFKIQNGFVFNNKLKIGSSKLEFSRIMKLEIPKNDTITIGDLEQNSNVDFIFKKNKLFQVAFKGYVD